MLTRATGTRQGDHGPVAVGFLPEAGLISYVASFLACLDEDPLGGVAHPQALTSVGVRETRVSVVVTVHTRHSLLSYCSCFVAYEVTRHLQSSLQLTDGRYPVCEAPRCEKHDEGVPDPEGNLSGSALTRVSVAGTHYVRSGSEGKTPPTSTATPSPDRGQGLLLALALLPLGGFPMGGGNE